MPEHTCQEQARSLPQLVLHCLIKIFQHRNENPLRRHILTRKAGFTGFITGKPNPQTSTFQCLRLLHVTKSIAWEKEQINTSLAQTSEVRQSLTPTAQSANPPHGTAGPQGDRGGGKKNPPKLQNLTDELFWNSAYLS